MSATDLIHRCILKRGQMARSALGPTLGLSSRSVKVAVDTLLERGDIAIAGYKASTGGRRSQILGAGLGPDARVAMGMIFRQDEIKILLLSSAGEVLVEEAIKGMPASWDELFCGRVCERVLHFRDKHVGSHMNLCGMGISSVLAFQAMVLPDAKWGDQLVSRLSSQLSVPVYRELLVRCVTLAEYLFSTNNKEPEMAYLSVMDHVEMGAVMGGRLLCSTEATRSSALGHFSIVPDGEACYCGGRGCLESYVSNPRVLDQVRSALDAGQDSSLKNIPRESLTMYDVMAQFVAGDALATEQMHRVVTRLIPALRAIQLLLSPRLIVLGGYLRHGGQPLIDLIQESFSADLPVQAMAARIRLGAPTHRQQEIGAAALALAYDLCSVS